MSSYRFGDVVEIANVTRNQLKRWTQIGLIVPQGAGDPTATWRKFTMRNLIEARVCDICRVLGVAEQTLQRIVRNLNAIWDQPDAPIDSERPGVTFADATVLWVEFYEGEWPTDLRAETEANLQDVIARVAAETGAAPTDIRAKLESAIEESHPDQAALVRGERSTIAFAGAFPLDDEGLIQRVTGPHADSGIVIQLARIIREIETRTGDVFDIQSHVRKLLAEELAKLDKGHE